MEVGPPAPPLLPTLVVVVIVLVAVALVSLGVLVLFFTILTPFFGSVKVVVDLGWLGVDFKGLVLAEYLSNVVISTVPPIISPNLLWITTEIFGFFFFFLVSLYW